MTRYVFNDEGFFVSIVKTNDEEYLFSENSTEIEPPHLNENQVCRFDGEGWTVENVSELPIVIEPTIQERVSAIEEALLMML